MKVRFLKTSKLTKKAFYHLIQNCFAKVQKKEYKNEVV